MQDVQVLTLVLVEVLDLDIEQRFGIHRDPGLLPDEPGQPRLVVLLDPAPAGLEFGIVGQPFQPF